MRVTQGQRQRCFGLLVAGGDVWACVLELHALRRRRGDQAIVSYQGCAASWRRRVRGRSANSAVGCPVDPAPLLRRLVRHRRPPQISDESARYPRRRRQLLPSRYDHGTFRRKDGHLKAQVAGIAVCFVDERGTSSHCPVCARPVPKPKSRTLRCPACGHTGHRDVAGARNIAARIGGGTTSNPLMITHRRAGRHLPGAGLSRRDPRRFTRGRGPGPPRPAPEPDPESCSPPSEDQPTTPNEANVA